MKRIVLMKMQQLQGAILLQGPVHVPEVPVDQGQGGPDAHDLRAVLGHVVRGRDVLVHDHHGILWNTNILHLYLF